MQRAEPFARLRDRVGPVVFGGDVQPAVTSLAALRANRSSDCLALVVEHVAEQHARSRARKETRFRLALSPACAGDEGHLAGQVGHALFPGRAYASRAGATSMTIRPNTSLPRIASKAAFRSVSGNVAPITGSTRPCWTSPSDCAISALVA